MVPTNQKALPLRESSRILRPVAVDRLMIPQSWTDLISEFELAVDDGATGMVFLAGPKGSGKTSFMKLLHRTMTKHPGVITLYGNVVEPISNSGWLMPFLSDILSGTNGPTLSHRAVIDRLQDLAENHSCIALFIDGADHISNDALTADLAGLMSLTEDAGLPFLTLTNVNESSVTSLAESALLSGKSTMVRTLPRFTDEELRDIIETRIQEADILQYDFKSKIQTVIANAQGVPAKALRQLIDMASLENPSNAVATKPKSRLVSEAKQKKGKQAEIAAGRDASDKQLRENDKNQVKKGPASYDDLLNIKKLGS